MTARKAPAAVASWRGMERGSTILWMECGACSGESMAILGAEGRGKPGHTLPAFLEDHGAELLWHPSLSLESPSEAAAIIDRVIAGEQPLTLLCVEGSIIHGPNGTGRFDVFEGRPKRDIVAALCGRAQYVLAMGSCASFGGIPAAPPNPSESTGLQYTNSQPGGLLDPEWRSAGGLPVILGLRRGERELPGQPDRLAGQVHPGGRASMSGRVDEVEHAQHDGEVAGPVQPAPAQRALGAADPLRHRRLGDVEGVGDLLGGEAADGAQGQRDLGSGGEVGVTAAEEQEQGVVALLRGGRRRQLRVRRLLAALPGGLAAAGVDEPPGRDRGQPRARVVRRVLGPDPERLQQRLLQRVLGGVEVLAAAHQARQHPRDEGAQGALVQPPHRPVDHAAQSSDGASDMTSRTSSHS
jgi:hypothetical protein